MMWDYIVIGAGSAGCALAGELSASGASVLLLEAGGSDRSPYIRLPATVFRAIDRHDWGYRAEADQSRNGIRENWYRGKVVGGSSSINGTKYVRPAAADFRRWSTLCDGQGGWGPDDVFPIFASMERSDQLDPARGRKGPLHVRTVKHPHRLSSAFVHSAVNAGLPYIADFNGKEQEGVAYTQFSQKRGLRFSASDAFLKPNLRRRNLRLLTHALVEKIELMDGRATAVWFQHKGAQRRETARDVILSAGAVNSPKILQLSGIGDADDIAKIGLTPVMHLPAVGRNFRDQPLLRLIYRTKIPSYNLTEGFSQKLAIAAKFAAYGEGPISNLFEAVAFLKSQSSETAPDIRLTFLALAYLREEDGTSKLADFPAISVSVIKSYPLSAGRITLASPRMEDPPIIHCPLFQEREDLATMVRGIAQIRRIMSTDPIRSLIDAELSPGASLTEDAELVDFIRKNTGLSYHSIGSCRMGTGQDAVVDPSLRVKGVENLWIADASIMPDHVSADTNAVCMMIGMKLGRELASRRSYGFIQQSATLT